jgi:hypothetical protein
MDLGSSIDGVAVLGLVHISVPVPSLPSFHNYFSTHLVFPLSLLSYGRYFDFALL